MCIFSNNDINILQANVHKFPSDFEIVDAYCNNLKWETFRSCVVDDVYYKKKLKLLEGHRDNILRSGIDLPKSEISPMIYNLINNKHASNPIKLKCQLPAIKYIDNRRASNYYRELYPNNFNGNNYRNNIPPQNSSECLQVEIEPLEASKVDTDCGHRKTQIIDPSNLKVNASNDNAFGQTSQLGNNNSSNCDALYNKNASRMRRLSYVSHVNIDYNLLNNKSNVSKNIIRPILSSVDFDESELIKPDVHLKNQQNTCPKINCFTPEPEFHQKYHEYEYDDDDSSSNTTTLKEINIDVKYPKKTKAIKVQIKTPAVTVALAQHKALERLKSEQKNISGTINSIND